MNLPRGGGVGAAGGEGGAGRGALPFLKLY